MFLTKDYSNKLKARGDRKRDCTDQGEDEEMRKARRKEHLGYRVETATAAQGRWVTRQRPARGRQATKGTLEDITQVKLSTRNSMQIMCDHHTG